MVLWRLRHSLSLRDLSEMLLMRDKDLLKLPGSCSAPVGVMSGDFGDGVIVLEGAFITVHRTLSIESIPRSVRHCQIAAAVASQRGAAKP